MGLHRHIYWGCLVRGILIDPTARSVTEIQYSGDYKQIYTLCDFDLFECAQIDEEHTLFIDEEGLLKNNSDFFRILGDPPRSFAGKGLILGLNYSGESVGSQLTVDDIKERVKFFEDGEIVGWLG